MLKPYQDNSDVSRRRFFAASGGLLVASVLPLRPSIAQEVGDQSPADVKDLIFRTEMPRNGEPELQKLMDNWITPTRHFYVRSHAPNPVIDAADYGLRIEGMVHKPQTMKLRRLKQLAKHKITATLTCAGNRRAEFNAEKKVGGVQWGAGAIGNATWEGVSLADVLRQAIVQEGASHVWFEGLDQIQRDDGVIPFGASIPLAKAMQTGETPGALVAYKMNESPLTADHGFPLRTVVPGYIGARSVKWLGRIVVSDRPSPNHYVAHAYKVVAAKSELDWNEAGPIYRYPINSVICSPASEAKVASGQIEVAGFALPSGRAAARIKEVFVSADDGSTWAPAELTGKSAPFCWQFWQASVSVTAATSNLLVRASDTAGAFMPERIAWNAKGYMQNSWFKSALDVE